ncbi:Hemolysin-III channel protein Izh2 [Mycena indigotica]|uniref:Hemolysin-III channel protein Izh2 n=1 Tax=Mycena indigotica TaxID=2126181 RepID=A0A8H6SI62_9AGAR|nr:Hemolysin-III channel protein Izh2 [Mycena indigotica]KAF7298797.1 Hemolysin-III channel protein Izh2 [Mycena indigotica]
MRLRRNSGSTPGPVHKLRSSTTTITFHELPAWAQDNEWIVGGYRRIQNRWTGCMISVFGYLHNETGKKSDNALVNIHTHLAGALLFVYFLATFQEVHLKQYPTTWMDSLMLGIFLASAIFCLSISATFHTAACHSKEVSAQCLALDYSGIVFLTVGSFYPAVHFGFFCYPRVKAFYLLLLTAIGMGAAYIVLNPQYSRPTHRGARTAVFIGLGLSGVIPALHGVLHEGLYSILVEHGVRWILLSGALYIGGGLLYANRIPERWAPGRFDYFFASHQIFHVCVVLAVCSHYNGVLTGLRHSYSDPDVCANAVSAI